MQGAGFEVDAYVVHDIPCRSLRGDHDSPHPQNDESRQAPSVAGLAMNSAIGTAPARGAALASAMLGTICWARLSQAAACSATNSACHDERVSRLAATTPSDTGARDHA